MHAGARQDSASCRGAVLPFLHDSHQLESRIIPSILEVAWYGSEPVRRRCQTDHTLIFALKPGYRAPRNEEVMSMDRLSRVLAGGALTLALGHGLHRSGCRSMRNEVPRASPTRPPAQPAARSASTPTPIRARRSGTECISPTLPDPDLAARRPARGHAAVRHAVAQRKPLRRCRPPTSTARRNRRHPPNQ